MVGENEKMYPAQKAVHHLNRVAPQIETEVIPQAGHDLTFVQAETVNSEILDFLEHRQAIKSCRNI
jgi:pimeloyl-ACP methyl ester carboxylesterase